MTLLLTVFAAVISTVIWYMMSFDNGMKIGTLCFMFWGASIMWFVDAIAEYIEAGAEFFTPSAADMLNDFYLGLSVIAIGLVIWLVQLLITDPKGKVRKALIKR